MYVQAEIPKVIWLSPLGYKINIIEASALITIFVEEVDNEATTFGNYDVAKSKITMDLKTTLVIRKKNKMVNKLKDKFGEGTKEEEEEEYDDDDNAFVLAPISITQGQGKDQQEEEVEIIEGDEGEQASEARIATKRK